MTQHPIRADLVDTHEAVIASLGRPGTFWTSAERVAIAATVRDAAGQPDRPPWYNPSDDRDPDEDGDRASLPAAAIDAIWRLTNHPSTVTGSWCASTIAGLDEPEHYVELLGIVAAVNAIDRFARIVDRPLVELPVPSPGQPTRQRVAGAAVTTHWVPTARGEFNGMVLQSLTAVPAAESLVHEVVGTHYMPIAVMLSDWDYDRGTLNRRQIELIAARTSFKNDCFY
ncbi:MAG: alkylhydroperoxidase-related (seleno)protein [Actinomycetota bacterium]